MKRKNQPSPSGSSLTSSGVLSNSEFTSSTSPSSGMPMLLAAFTDSSTDTSAPASKLPSSGT
ncbi:hypothetical protein D3C78_1927030 [compost metagenome]